MLLVGAGTLTACVDIAVIRLTNEPFEPKASGREVLVLFKEPACPHIKLAELSGDETALSGLDSIQLRMLEKAAELGADALVFLGPVEQVRRHLKYQQDSTVVRPAIGWAFSSYPGWGYGAYASRFGGLGASSGPEEAGLGRPASGFGAAGFSPGVSGLGHGMGVATPYEVPVTSLLGIAVRYTGSTAGSC